MKKDKEIKWLYGQFPDLLKRNILTEETVLKLREHYGPEPQSTSSNLVFIITSVLGATLIGSGIILLFATNWEELSIAQRTVLSFLPLIVAQIFYVYAFFKKRGSTSWSESTSVFLMFMLASTIALIDQTYNTGGKLQNLVLTWMILSIPLLYLMNSSIVCMFYLIGISYWAVMSHQTSQSVWYWPLLAAAVPHLLMNIHQSYISIRGNILGWSLSLSVIVAVGFLAGDFGGKYVALTVSIVSVFLYLSGKILNQTGQSMWSRPLQTVPLFVITSYALSLSYEWHLRSYKYYLPENSFYPLSIAMILFSIGILALLVYHIKNNTGINYFVVIFPVLVGIGIMLYSEGSDESKNLPVIIFNIYSLAFGIFYIWYGISKEKIAFINAGMFLVSVLIAERFFDRHISFMVKGIVFIMLGIAFLSVNVILMNKYKQKKIQ